MKRKGLYVSNIDRAISVGYSSKITGQIQGLRKHGFEFELICFSEKDEVVLQQFPAEYNLRKTAVTVLSQCSRNIISKRKNLFRETLRRLSVAEIDVLYLRYPRSDPFYLAVLFKVKRLYPNISIICEFPTFPYDQENSTQKQIKSLLMNGLDRSTRKFLKYFVDKAVVVDYAGDVFGIDGIEISNGISVDSFPLKKNELKKDEFPIHLLGVANVKPWHGYDRVISGLGTYYRNLSQNKEVFFHIVGACEPAFRDLKAQSIACGVEDYVLFHPPAQGENLDRLFNMSDIAISTLGAHRIGLQKLSPLKTREYCARAIPFILGYIDGDFPLDFDYALTVPSDDSPIDITSVFKFFQPIKNDPNARMKIREHAEQYLDWSKKMSSVARQMSEIISHRET